MNRQAAVRMRIGMPCEEAGETLATPSWRTEIPGRVSRKMPSAVSTAESTLTRRWSYAVDRAAAVSIVGWWPALPEKSLWGLYQFSVVTVYRRYETGAVDMKLEFRLETTSLAKVIAICVTIVLVVVAAVQRF